MSERWTLHITDGPEGYQVLHEALKCCDERPGEPHDCPDCAVGGLEMALRGTATQRVVEVVPARLLEEANATADATERRAIRAEVALMKCEADLAQERERRAKVASGHCCLGPGCICAANIAAKIREKP